MVNPSQSMPGPDERRLVPSAGSPPAASYYAEGPVPDHSESFPLLDFLQSLRRHKGLIFICCFLGGVTGLLLTLPQTPVYQASATLELQAINPDFLQMRNVNPTNEGGNDYYPDYDIQTQIQIMESRTLLDRVVYRLKQERHYTVAHQSRFAQWKEALGLHNPVSATDEALGFAQSRLRVRAKPNTRLLQITCDSTDPRLAADFINTLTAEYVDQSLAARWQATQHTGEWLTRQMEDVRVKLEQSEDQLQRYARETGLMFTSEKDNVSEQRLRQMQEELGKATADRIAKQSKYELASKTAPDTLADVLDDPVLRDYQGKLTELRRQAADLGYSFTEDYPKVKKLQAQIGALETAFAKTRADIIRRINNDYQISLQREQLLAANYASQAHLVAGQADKVTHYNILKHEVDTGRQLYDSLLQRVKEASVASALRATNIRVVDAADVPEAPYKPSGVFQTGAGALGGLFLGVWLAVVRARVDRTLSDPRQTNLHLGVPMLGLIPSASIGKRKRVYSWTGAQVKPQCVDSAISGRLELASWQDNSSLLAEAFRSTSTSLLLSANHMPAPRVLVVTSPQPREGKTTTVCNLGITLAASNKRVLLVDGDMRRPSLSQVFGGPNEVGLSNLLSDPMYLDGSALDSVIQATPIPGLSILPSGPGLQISTSLLTSPRLKMLLDQLKSKYDMVVVDTPPMLQIPDARIFAKLSDRVVMVVRAARTTRETAQSALQRLADDGVIAAATVLNDWNPKDSGRYSVYRDYHRYYSHYYSKSSRDR
jgi:succinoglycan biosynthesis transport protein ExoP